MAGKFDEEITMKANIYLVAKASAEKGTIVLGCGLSTTYLRAVGTSVPMSAKPGDHVTSFAIAPKKEGVVAVGASSVGGGKNRDTRTDYFFLSVEKSDKGFRINLDEPWTPLADRLGQIVDYGDIEVEIDGERYTSNVHGKDRPGFRYVPDANLLCQYLAGDIGPQDVINAATEHIEEQEARKMVPGLQKQLAEVKSLSLETKKEAEEYFCTLMTTTGDLAKLQVATEALVTSVMKQFFKRPSVKRALGKLSGLLK
jgi:hypothetical protein